MNGHDAMGSMDHGVNYHALWMWKNTVLTAGFFAEPGHKQYGAAYAVGAFIRGWGLRNYGSDSFQLGALVVEKPEIRAVQSQKGRQKDIIELAMSVGMVIAEVRASTTLEPTPSHWSNGKGKPPRHRAALACLTQAERDIVTRVLGGVAKTYHEDMMDALALGAWATRRAEW